MKKNLSRILSVFLLICILGGTLISCKGNEENETDTITATTVSEGEKYYLDTLPRDKYEYSDVTFITIDSNCVSEEYLDRADSVDAKKFERDAIIRDRFGIELKYVRLEGSTDAERTQILFNGISGGGSDCGWDIIIASADTLMSLTINGATRKLNTLENIDLDREWWCQSMNNNIRFNDSQYVACGPVAEWFYGSALALAYNIDMANEYHMPDIYELVLSGKWTLEEMRKLCSDYGFVDTAQGKYAISFSSGVGPYGLFASAGGRFSTFNEKGEIIVDIGSETSVNILESILKTFDPDKTFYGTVGESTATFTEERALFYYTTVGWMEQYLPSSEVRYGIAPCPKLNETDEYVSCAWPSSAFSTAVPVTVSEERSGFVGLVLEAYCFLGYDIIKPVKYDSIVKYRVATDEKSSQVLDVIFDNLYFDLNLVMNLGGSRGVISNAILNGMGRYSNSVKTIENNIASDIAKYDALTKQ
ncbi:MAG: hypothetical protein ACI3XQ_09685 [Eubacteriales bacterium]